MSDQPGTQGRFSPFAAAAVAAAVLLTGGGVAYVAGTAGSSGSAAGDSPAGSGKDGDPPPLELDGYGAGPGSASAADAIKATGKLPGGPDEAAVRTAEGTVSRGAVARLAAALDVPGKPRQQGESWLVGTARDGQGPLLRVSVAAPGLWSYDRYRAGGDVPCELPRPVKPDSSSSSGDTPRPVAVCLDATTTSSGGSSGPADAGGDPVSPEAARKAVAPVLAAVGQKDAKVDAESTGYGALRRVAAQPRVAGLPTWGWETSVMVGADGKPASANGRLSALEKGHTYPVQSAAATLKELNKVRGGIAQGSPEEKLRSAPACASAVPDAAGKRSGGGSRGEIAQECPQPPAGIKAPTVRGAVFGLSAQSVAGEQALVPSWIYTLTSPTGREADTSKLAFPAVKPEFIKYRQVEPPSAAEPPANPEPGTPTPESSRPEPKPKPTQEPGTPGKGRTTMEIDSYTVSGTTLTVRFWGGVCSNYSATADEGADSVKVRVTGVDKKPGAICVKVARLFEEKVALKKDLDGRKVMDASDGEAVARK
ncbi:hypothetical protein [Streptomyces boninensis]|uniref:hypothetical protein n=1 Tax=Streptomyces boninensis TaxID=2039455 RepID=UPI003B20C2DB